jgi:hypothetical protein
MLEFAGRRILALGGALACLACGSAPGGGAAGELGQGTFTYECVNDGDAHCASRSEIDEFDGRDLGDSGSMPRAVAVGSTFGLTYAGRVRDDGDRLLVQVEPAYAEDELAAEVFSVGQPTEAAFLAVDSDGRAVDFVVLTVLEATEINLWRDERTVSTLSLTAGQALTLPVVPQSDDGALLAGALSYTWTTTDESVVSLDGGAEVLTEGEVEIAGEGEGSAQIRVVSGDLIVRVNVEVLP